jgi:hypothetical protein
MSGAGVVFEGAVGGVGNTYVCRGGGLRDGYPGGGVMA